MTIDSGQVFQFLGLFGQLLFFLRGLVQWLASERARRIVVPFIFWWMSLAGTLFILTYNLYRQDLIFVAGSVVPLFIYPRNIILARTGRSLDRGLLVALALGFVALTALTAWFDLHEKLRDLPTLWLAVGVLGQALWLSRFLLQWWISERIGRSTLPPAFFWVSLFGSVLLLGYAIYRADLVNTLGQCLGAFIYPRSLWLHYRGGGKEPAPDSA